MNSLGRLFKITLYGTSHGQEIGIIIDGCPVGISISDDDFYDELNRRKSNNELNTIRNEDDKIIISAGIYNGFTDGSPILLSFKNNNINNEDYNFIKEGFFRPGHADFTAFKKYKGFNNANGGGMFSGRMTLALVAAGVIAKKILQNISFKSKMEEFWVFGDKNHSTFNKIDDAKLLAKQLKTTIGGKISLRIENMPIGLGEPFFDSIESVISHAIFSIPGATAIEFDFPREINSNAIINENGKLNKQNYGINGGISNANNINFKVAFKAPSSIEIPQETFNFKTKKIESFTINGRHDKLYLNRSTVIVEAMTAIALVDLFLIAKTQS